MLTTDLYAIKSEDSEATFHCIILFVLEMFDSLSKINSLSLPTNSRNHESNLVIISSDFSVPPCLSTPVCSPLVTSSLVSV